MTSSTKTLLTSQLQCLTALGNYTPKIFNKHLSIFQGGVSNNEYQLLKTCRTFLFATNVIFYKCHAKTAIDRSQIK